MAKKSSKPTQAYDPTKPFLSSVTVQITDEQAAKMWQETLPLKLTGPVKVMTNDSVHKQMMKKVLGVDWGAEKSYGLSPVAKQAAEQTEEWTKEKAYALLDEAIKESYAEHPTKAHKPSSWGAEKHKKEAATHGFKTVADMLPKEKLDSLTKKAEAMQAAEQAAKVAKAKEMTAGGNQLVLADMAKALSIFGEGAAPAPLVKAPLFEYNVDDDKKPFKTDAFKYPFGIGANVLFVPGAPAKYHSGPTHEVNGQEHVGEECDCIVCAAFKDAEKKAGLTAEPEIKLFNFPYGSIEPKPDVASEKGNFSEDGKTYTVKIRKGLKFANGHELTASDVAFSFKRVVTIGANGKDLGNGPSSLLSDMESVEAKDDSTVVFKLKTPFNVLWEQILCTAAGPIVDEEVFSPDALTSDDDIVKAKPFAGP